jgi:N-acetylmuramoyl-L-alanine amidase
MNDRRQGKTQVGFLQTVVFKRTVVVLMLGLVLAGCQQPEGQQKPTKLASTGISAYELARQLGLSVSQIDETSIKLKNETNLVMIFTYTNAKFYVNGKACGPVGKIERVGNSVYVEPGLVALIKPCLITGQSPSKVLAQGQRPTMGTIVIDPGHGGKDPGAPSALGFQEKAINLAVAKQLASILSQRGFRTVLTRDRDVYIEKKDRAAVANRCNADLFVSIHADAAESRSLNGFTVYTARGAGSQSKWAARAIVNAMNSTGLDSNGVREADYVVLVQTDCPAVLVEVGYLSNFWEAGKLRDPDMQKRLAQAIAEGVVRSMGR